MSQTPIANSAPISVAVIIPYYNGKKFIERSLASVYRQTMRPSELIVVDDGSAAEESLFLKNLSEKLNFKYLYKENGGQGSARNEGVKQSISDYICFLDQDDFFLDSHIEILANGIPKNDKCFGFVYGDVNEADSAGEIISVGMINPLSTHPKRSVLDMLKSDMFILPSAAMIHRKAFETVNGFDTQFTGYEDDDLFLRIFRKGFSNTYINEPVTVWCIHSASTSYSIKMSRSRFRYFEKLVRDYPDEPQRHRFFVRQYTIPRFGPSFIRDTIKFDRHNDPKDEIHTILVKYHNYVCKTRDISLIYKGKLWLYIAVYRILPFAIREHFSKNLSKTKAK